MPQQAVLVLADGSIFHGTAIGAYGEGISSTVGEVVFNTAMTGYQEILTDPSYANQMVTFTYPHIGNVGINEDDFESRQVYAKGLIIKALPFLDSNWRKKQSLHEFLKSQNILGIANIDTRYLTQIIRENGALNGMIVSAKTIDDALIEKCQQDLKNWPGIKGQDLAQVVSTSSPYIWEKGGVWQPEDSDVPPLSKSPSYKVIAYDFGIKQSILRQLHDKGCHVTVVPCDMPFKDVIAQNPDGVFLSNGPGDPEPCDYAIENIKGLLQANIPIFGICLGFQLMALAMGAKTFKMPFGHHGGNHPVQDMAQKHVMITSQNHGFAVDEKTLPKSLKVTHRSLFDQTIQGFEHQTYPLYGFQGHPEAGPGPNDATMIFDKFIQDMAVRQRQPQKDVALL